MDVDRLIKTNETVTVTKLSSKKMNQCLSGDDNNETPAKSERHAEEENHAHGLVRLSIQVCSKLNFLDVLELLSDCGL